MYEGIKPEDLGMKNFTLAYIHYLFFVIYVSFDPHQNHFCIQNLPNLPLINKC